MYLIPRSIITEASMRQQRELQATPECCATHLPPAFPHPCSRRQCHRHRHTRWAALCAVHRRGLGLCHCGRNHGLEPVREQTRCSTAESPSESDNTQILHWAPRSQASLQTLQHAMARPKVSLNVALAFSDPRESTFWVSYQHSSNRWLLNWL